MKDRNQLQDSRITALFWIFALVTAVFQMAVVQFNALDLAPDEAHYWEWSKRLDLAYYSKGPLVAICIALSTTVFGDTALGVRFPAILCEFLFSLVLFFTARKYRGAKDALFLVVVLRSTVAFLSMGFAMTTDPLVMLPWLLAVIVGGKGIESGSTRYWILFGLYSGLAVLAKYTAILLPVAAAGVLVVDREARKNLRSVGPYMGAVTVLLLLIPVLYWNWLHDWVNLSHNKGHLAANSPLAAESVRIHLNYLVELIGSQLGLIGPLLWPVLLVAIWVALRRWGRGELLSGQAKLALASALLLLGSCLSVSLTRRVYANWPLPIVISGVLLLIELWPADLKIFRRLSLRNTLKLSLSLNLIFFIILHLIVFGVTLGVPGRYLTTKKLVGWSTLAKRVESLQKELPGVEIAAENYDIASSLAFELHQPGKLLCVFLGGRRMNQYDIWGGWENVKGRDFLLVTKEEALGLSHYFRKVTFREEISVPYAGDIVQKFRIYFAEDYSGKAFPLPEKR